MESEQFVFVVGENQEEFTVHAAIIAQQSEALDALINGSIREASDTKAIFTDVTEDTFIRFCQFAYTSDYTTPDFTWTPTTELESELESELIDNSLGSLLRQSLNDQCYNTDIVRMVSDTRCEVRPNSNDIENCTSVFLGHAQLYVLAEKWCIKSLKALALSKIHETLTSFTLYAARRSDIVELLRYTFSNDNTPDLIDGVDDLRSLVMLYRACEVENLIHYPEFISLIGEDGQLAQDLVQILMKRID